MPDQPKTQLRSMRIDDADWEDFGTAAEGQGTNRRDAVAEFIRWYVGRPGAELPQRPPVAQGPA